MSDGKDERIAAAITHLAGTVDGNDRVIRSLREELKLAEYAVKYAAARERFLLTNETHEPGSARWRTDRTLWRIARDAYRAVMVRTENDDGIDGEDL